MTTDGESTAPPSLFEGILVLLVLTLARGLVLRSLWAWFLVPLGLPQIGIVHAAGIVWMSFIFRRVDVEAEMATGTNILIDMVALALTLILGWVLHVFA